MAPTVVFLGAGSAGVGVAKQLVQYFMKEGGLTEEQAKKIFYLFVASGAALVVLGEQSFLRLTAGLGRGHP